MFKTLLLYLILLCISSACFAASPNSTTIPTATQIVDSNGGVWTVSGGLCYLNGVQAGTCQTVETLLWFNGEIYALSTYGGGTWWLWNGTGWTEVAQDPRTGTSAASASGTTIPAATQIVDSNGGVWTVSGGVCYLNGVQAGTCQTVKTLLWFNGEIYALSTYEGGTWWLWNGSNWTEVAQDPRTGGPGASTSGTTIPTATQIVDSNGGVWTVSGGVCYLNGVQAGTCQTVETLLWFNGQIYVLSAYGGGTWWLWNGTGWTEVAQDPRTIVSASGTTVPPAKQIVDSNGGVWTLSGGLCYRNGVQAGNCNSVKALLWFKGQIYVFNTLNQWWQWNGSGWTEDVGNPWVASPNATTAVLTHHNDNLRTGWNKTETTLTPTIVSSAAGKFGAIATVSLDDQVDAQPLIVPQQQITCANNETSICQPGTYQVVYVATESNTIYAINAANGAILLQRNFGSPVPAPLGCNNNGPNVGINGTPVIDPNMTTLYFIAYTLTNGQNSAPTHTLHAVNLADLTDSVSPATVAASHILKNGGTYNFNPTYQRQRAGLLFSGGTIYAGFGSWCDLGANQSRGWLLGWNASNLAPLNANQLDDRLTTSPNSFFLSSIWMSGSGIAADDLGNLWFTTGNSDQSGTTYDGVYNIQESVVRIRSDLTGVLSIFTPSNWATLDQNDADFGSGGVLKILPQAAGNPQLVAAAGKDGRMFVLNSSNLGGYTPGGPDKVAAETNIGQCWCTASNFMGSDGIGRIVSSGNSNIIVWKIIQPSSAATQLVQESSTPIVGAQIIDSNGGVWTASGSGGICYLNGVQVGGCADVQTILYYNANIYVLSEDGIWWAWNGINAFVEVGTADPRATSAQVPGAPPTQSITPTQDGGFFTSVSSNGQGPAIIWTTWRPNAAGIVTLYAFAATSSNGTIPLIYSSPAGTWPNLGGNANIVPVVANGRVFVASFKLLTIFGVAAL
jgi:hypothetical protein